MGMVHCVRSALPCSAKAQWARIVNFSAHSTQRQSVILPAYTAPRRWSPASQRTCRCRWRRRDHGQRGVAGSIVSESLAGWAESVGVDGSDPYAVMSAIDKHFGHPAHLPRAGCPQEIGPVVAFLRPHATRT
jgi:NAD(P)-dependent dehydrogenase (short-subunit alcohol dehydrogenase family)